MGVVVHFVDFINIRYVLILQIIIGILVYVFFSFIFKISSFYEN